MHCTMHLGTMLVDIIQLGTLHLGTALRHHDFFPLNIWKTSHPVSTGITTNYTPSRLQRTTVIATPRLQRDHWTPATEHTTHLGAIANSPKYSVIANMVAALCCHPTRSYCTITLRESSLNCRASLPFPGRSYHPSPTIPPHLPSIPSMDHSRARSHCCAPFS